MSFFTVNYFILFGLEPQFLQNPDKIKAGYLKLQQELHPDRFVGAAPQTKQLAVHYTAEVNQAYQTLSDPILRALYILKQQGNDVDQESVSVLSPEFLAIQMDFREELENLKEDFDEPQYEKLKHQITILRDEIEQSAEYPKDLMSVQKVQFFAKLQNELEAIASTTWVC